MLGLYVHIPFCKSKCPYCSFNSLDDRRLVPAYLEALQKEAVGCGEQLRDGEFSTLYIGGGTPSVLLSLQLQEIVTCFQKTFRWADGKIERTLEVNPETVTGEAAHSWLKMGFNRVSMGVQSFQDRFLRTLGRIHNAEKAREAYRILRKAGFSNVSIDLIFALPGQTLQDWKKDLQEAIRLQPDHISLYGLTIEEGSKWHELSNLPTCQLSNIDSDDLAADMYNLARQMLKRAGFEHYEISSFARPGKRSQHNQLYWRSEEYIGLGAGAHSHLDGRRWANPRRVEEYVKGVTPPKPETMLPSARFREAVVLGLRMVKDGVNLEELERRLGIPCPADLEEDLRRLACVGEVHEPPLLFFDPPHVCLTNHGVLFADRVAVELI